ncbi:hypothetical protein P175DRAFT_04170 [Aspergillus ochraceoroseus IBT 24754]|uniref:Uncharacterized protein n=1 Tax=Aspergillus ochraceoroseus IBT 24754 TaxID=1392256 RepID=A0A2T5M5C4_9EURO|nr:uncharacterized protein P175DRAFT_04170 [Aspergillus ochraceoroseus IBT 24754]PTU23732.1 hypothetical protein P175DRAFT_04170 [Aspergillus ochraceoroseus IBT 24754]
MGSNFEGFRMFVASSCWLSLLDSYTLSRAGMDSIFILSESESPSPLRSISGGQECELLLQHVGPEEGSCTCALH